MKKTLVLIGVLLSCLSCVTNKTQDEMQSFSFDVGGDEKIQKQCEEIKAAGDIFSLLWEIKRDTRFVIQTLERKPYKGMEDDIGELAQKIDSNSERVIELSKDEWNKTDVRQSIKWSLSDTDFGSRNYYLSAPTVRAVYFLGKEMPELVKRVRIMQSGNDFTIEYLNMATILEYCQLNQTLMIVIEVNVHGFTGIKNKIFNLNVHLEQ